MAGMAASKLGPRLLTRWALKKDSLAIQAVTVKRKTMDSDVSLGRIVGGGLVD